MIFKNNNRDDYREVFLAYLRGAEFPYPEDIVEFSTGDAFLLGEIVAARTKALLVSKEENR